MSVVEESEHRIGSDTCLETGIPVPGTRGCKTHKKVEFQENREKNEPEEIFEKITTMNFPKLIEDINDTKTSENPKYRINTHTHP